MIDKVGIVIAWVLLFIVAAMVVSDGSLGKLLEEFLYALDTWRVS